jgi:hypothetical protein
MLRTLSEVLRIRGGALRFKDGGVELEVKNGKYGNDGKNGSYEELAESRDSFRF